MTYKTIVYYLHLNAEWPKQKMTQMEESEFIKKHPETVKMDIWEFRNKFNAEEISDLGYIEFEQVDAEPRVSREEKLAREIASAVNSSIFDVDAFAKYLGRQHRTLQQSTFRAMLAFIDFAASEEYSVDGRNSDTKKVAELIQNALHKYSGGEYPLKGFLGFV